MISKKNHWVIWKLYFHFILILKASILFPKDILPSAELRVSFLSHSCQQIASSLFWYMSNFEFYHIYILNCILFLWKGLFFFFFYVQIFFSKSLGHTQQCWATLTLYLDDAVLQVVLEGGGVGSDDGMLGIETRLGAWNRRTLPSVLYLQILTLELTAKPSFSWIAAQFSAPFLYLSLAGFKTLAAYFLLFRKKKIT